MSDKEMKLKRCLGVLFIVYLLF
uniref:Uncharacterized protein n=1 Tax=Anguilla anguilla TaxID=7936 RepID=A0A0E9PF13_ANGAN